MTDCIFCKIVAGEIPAAKVYEDDDVLAFLDITQVTKGHTLLIPKKHFRNIFEMSSEEVTALTAKIPALANRLREALSADGMNIMSNLEVAAGQSVFHTHIHLLPRYKGDKGVEESFFREKEPVKAEELAEIAEKIKGAES